MVSLFPFLTDRYRLSTSRGVLIDTCLTPAPPQQCLIGLLGPVTASVANLLAIGLVALVDAAYLGRQIPFLTLVGANLVSFGFGVLMYEGEGEAAGEVDDEEDYVDVDVHDEDEEDIRVIEARES
jgi:hypothetical protein